MSQVAHVETLIDDQGGGKSWCDNCRYDLTHEAFPDCCPSCNLKLVYGHVAYNIGTSD